MKLIGTFIAAFAFAGASVLASTNLPPQVSILWPTGGSFAIDSFVKIKAEATDPDGSVALVQFYADSTLIAAVTNEPFTAIWNVLLSPYAPVKRLTAVAVDNLGARTQSKAVDVFIYSGAPTQPLLRLVSPDRVMFSAPAIFGVSAELLVSLGDAGPVEFLLGTTSLGIVTQSTSGFRAETPLYSLTVSNVTEGQYQLTTRYLGANGPGSLCGSPTLTVTKLGIGSPMVTQDGRIQFEVVTSFPKAPTIIESSADLVHWIPISTNVAPENTFTFVEPTSPMVQRSFYRARVPP